ncbi:MAG TPA: LamG-like jellyroll fold domain-containing protein [Tepidisphaeraceae bacterium]|jgi:hypothetical protein
MNVGSADENLDPVEEARRLIDALLDGRLSPEGARRLQDLVCDHADVQRLYVRYMHLRCSIVSHVGVIDGILLRETDDDRLESPHAGMAETMVMPAIKAVDEDEEPPAIYVPPAPPARRPRPSLNWRLVRWSAAAVVALGIATSAWRLLGRQKPAGPTQVVAQPSAPPPVCNLVAAVNARWADGSPKPAGHLAPGTSLALASGIVQLQFTDGASVIVEGPAQLTTDSATAMSLLTGKVVATIPGGGFVVNTPTATVTDLGTEFGVGAEANGPTQVHVFKGRIQAAPRRQGGTQGEAPRVLANDQSADVSGKTVALTADQGLGFVRSAEFDARLKAAHGSAYDRWRAFGYQLRRDPALVAYYTFEKDPTRPAVLPNTAATGSISDGIITNVQWTEGRFPGKTAAGFADAKADIKVTIPGHFTSITLWVWVKPGSIPSGGYAALLLSDGGPDPDRLHWDISADRSLNLSGLPSPADKQVMRSAANAVPAASNDWVFLANVYDRDGTLRTYRNGRPFGPPLASKAIELGIGPAHIGNWDAYLKNPLPTDDRHFGGTFDELGVLSRPMTDAEILQLYSAGRP